MNKILTIAKNTFKECIRDRILYSILGFAVLFIISTIFFGSVSLGEDIKIIKDFGLAGIYIFTLIIAIFIGTSLVYKELEKRTVYITLSKPLSKTQFILGKFFGLIASMTVVTFLMASVYIIVVAIRGGGFDWRGLVSIAMSLPEIAIFISLSILFSTFSTPLASTIYAILLVFIGHSLGTVTKYFDKVGGIGKTLIQIAYYLLPNLEKFNLRNIVVHNLPINSNFILLSLCYGVFYCAIVLFLASWSLQKQEL